ncbi:uncharacterized protein UTRI_05630 [Ustilago trichophora]|uniref:Uncharacterized protein n=1 Tax=Ustilago trichophora TaxID=86804 RepID=A0A5C3EHH0_9BASI|nr:uncharacterized protein UTRI_05630 [Ustilago trichophora]
MLRCSKVIVAGSTSEFGREAVEHRGLPGKAVSSAKRTLGERAKLLWIDDPSKERPHGQVSALALREGKKGREERIRRKSGRLGRSLKISQTTDNSTRLNADTAWLPDAQESKQQKTIKIFTGAADADTVVVVILVVGTLHQPVFGRAERLTWRRCKGVLQRVTAKGGEG